MLASDEYNWRALQRANAGQKFLAAHATLSNWPTRVLRPIRMGSTKECILAQLFGTFRTGADALGLSDTDTVDLGFRGTTSELRTMKDFGRYYAVLSASWETDRRTLSKLP
jgi:hypothetical protein